MAPARLAELAQTTPDVIEALEAGSSDVDYTSAVRIAHSLGVRPDELFWLGEDEAPINPIPRGAPARLRLI
jgi:hypothetical protein